MLVAPVKLELMGSNILRPSKISIDFDLIIEVVINKSLMAVRVSPVPTVYRYLDRIFYRAMAAVLHCKYGKVNEWNIGNYQWRNFSSVQIQNPLWKTMEWSQKDWGWGEGTILHWLRIKPVFFCTTHEELPCAKESHSSPLLRMKAMNLLALFLYSQDFVV